MTRPHLRLVHNEASAQDRSSPAPEPRFLRSDNIRGVAPIPVEHLQALFEPRELADARRFADQRDTDEAYAEAVYDEIGELVGKVCVILAIVAALYFGGQLLRVLL